MSVRGNSRDVRRILVALDASPPSHVALEEAARLAARLHAELTGIFVMDTELLRLSALPAAHETGLTSARRRPLDPASMERALKLQAEQARTALETIAKQHRLQSSFRLLRGNVLAELLEAAAQTDLMALGAMGHMGVTGRLLGSTVRGITARASCSVLLTREARKGQAVVAIFGQSSNADTALELAVAVSAGREADLVVVLCGREEELPALRQRAAEELMKAGAKAVFETIAPERFDDLNAIMERRDGGLLVIGRDCELIEGREDQLGDLVSPLLLAR